jgi:hypothetical protein
MAKLIGSAAFGAAVLLAAGRSIPLDDLVVEAFKRSKLTEQQWNALDQATRDTALNATVAELKAATPADPDVKVTLAKPHTHAGKDYKAGDSIIVSQRVAQWLKDNDVIASDKAAS